MVEMRGSRPRKNNEPRDFLLIAPRSHPDRSRNRARKWIDMLQCTVLPCLALCVFFFLAVRTNNTKSSSINNNYEHGVGDQHHIGLGESTVQAGEGVQANTALEEPWSKADVPVVAFAISFTSLEMPGAASLVDAAEVLIGSIRKAAEFSSYGFETVAFVLPTVSQEGRRHIEEMGWKILERDLPVSIAEIEDESYRNHVINSGCCGADEFLKLYAYTLMEYHRVMHLDVDTFVLHSMDELMDVDASLVYTTDPAMSLKGQTIMPVQGGFLLVRPDLDVFERLCAVVRKGDWKKGKGWGNSGIGWFYGGATIQGLLPYFYHKLAIGASHEVDRCIYNHMSDSDLCRSDRYAVTTTLKRQNTNEEEHGGGLVYVNKNAAEGVGLTKMEVSATSIKSVHFTQECLKPWFCRWDTGKKKMGHCPSLQQAWVDGRRAIFSGRGLEYVEACGQKGYSPIPRK